MTENPLIKPSEWVTASEAAQLLEIESGGQVTEADVLQAGLDDQLELSVFLPEDTVAYCWKIDEATPPPLDIEEGIPSQYDDPTLALIDNVWRLPMVPPGSLQVEDWRNTLRGRPHIRLKGPHLPHLGLEGPLGAFVERPGLLCVIRAEGPRFTSPSSVLPAGSKIVVLKADILKFGKPSATTLTDAVDKPLVQREWKSEAIIVSALASKAGIDLSKELFKAAGVILSVVHDHLDLDGQTVIDISDTTIWGHLKRMKAAHPEALQRTNPNLKKTP